MFVGDINYQNQLIFLFPILSGDGLKRTTGSERTNIMETSPVLLATTVQSKEDEGDSEFVDETSAGGVTGERVNETEMKPLPEPLMATYLDVATLRCLFTSQWLEEGINWSLNFLIHR